MVWGFEPLVLVDGRWEALQFKPPIGEKLKSRTPRGGVVCGGRGGELSLDKPRIRQG